MLANVTKANNFLKTVDKDLNLIDETLKNKTRRQFDDWNKSVHGKIQQRISEQVNSIDSKSLNRLKNEDFSKFLSITNRKPAIFNDVIIEAEYDPLEPNRRCIQARTGYLKDPCDIDAQKAETESSMLGIKQPKQKLGKDTLNVELWRSGKIEGTPYGSYAKMMNKQKDGGGHASKTANKGRSNLVLDHFDYPTGRESVDKEMPRGKRCYAKTIHANPGKMYQVHGSNSKAIRHDHEGLFFFAC